MIQSFRGKTAQQVWDRKKSSLGTDVARAAHRKLLILDAATNVNDLRVPPGNRLEKLSGNRAGQHGIRVNGQWRICFVWTANGPIDVEIVDYH